MTIISLSAGDSHTVDEKLQQEQAAAERIRQRRAARAVNEEALSVAGGMTMVNTPDRIARRLDRVSNYYLDGTDAGAQDSTTVDVGHALQRAHYLTGSDESLDRTMEAIINSADFLGVRYLAAGVLASSSVGRINIGGGRAFGTGFLVTPRLLMTNHHVLPDADTARRGAVEFNYQDDVDGTDCTVVSFDLDPDTFFVNDKDLDVALAAVRSTPEQLAPFGFNRLTEAQGTIVIGEFTTIVQHPSGGKKMVSLRENKLVDILDRYLHYSADTERGSSGSPVFNDQWEVVALHHASVRDPDHPEFGGIINEGTRISQIISWLRGQVMTPARRTLLTPIVGDAARAPESADTSAAVEVRPAATSQTVYTPNGRFTVTVTVTDTAEQPHPDTQKATAP